MQTCEYIHSVKWSNYHHPKGTSLASPISPGNISLGENYFMEACMWLQISFSTLSFNTELNTRVLPDDRRNEQYWTKKIAASATQDTWPSIISSPNRMQSENHISRNDNNRQI